MTNKGYDGATPQVDGDVLSAVELNDSLSVAKFTKHFQQRSSCEALISHSNTAHSFLTSGNAIHLISGANGADTTTSKNTDLDTDSMIRVCEGTKTSGFAIEINATTAETALTSDSGTTWTTTTSAVFGGSPNDVSFPTTGLIVVGGDDTAGTDHVVFSTDSAATWTDATTSPGIVACLHMFDGTTGYVIDTSDNIWKTVNSAVDWTDTTDNFTTSVSNTSSMRCISSDIFFCSYISSGDFSIEQYTNSTNTITKVFKTIGTFDGTLGFIETTDGTLWTGAYNNDAQGLYVIAKSEDDGATWETCEFTSSVATVAAARTKKSSISEAGTDSVLIIIGEGKVMRISKN